jgi:hypothetical protein
VPDEFLGKTVRCPSCSETFRAPEVVATASSPAPAPAPAPPTPAAISPEPALDVPLQLELGDKRPAEGAAQPAEPARRRKPDDEDDRIERRRRRRDFESCPRCGDDIRRGAAVCPYCGYDLEEQADGYSRQPRVRLDAEPHRGGTVQSLGIASLVCAACYLFPLGIPLGIVAWVMGRRDLKRMEDGVMDPVGRKKTKDGWLCGLIGACLNIVWGLGCVGLVGLIIFIQAEEATNQPPPQAPAPVGPKRAAGQGGLFTLSGPREVIRIRRGETKPLRLEVRNAGPNAQRNVTVAIDPESLPDGVTMTPPRLVVAGGNASASFSIVAAKRAEPGNYTLHFTGTDNIGNEVGFDVQVRVEAK